MVWFPRVRAPQAARPGLCLPTAPLSCRHLTWSRRRSPQVRNAGRVMRRLHCPLKAQGLPLHSPLSQSMVVSQPHCYPPGALWGHPAASGVSPACPGWDWAGHPGQRSHSVALGPGASAPPGASQRLNSHTSPRPPASEVLGGGAQPSALTSLPGDSDEPQG